jgi:hypothetical protein
LWLRWKLDQRITLDAAVTLALVQEEALGDKPVTSGPTYHQKYNARVPPSAPVKTPVAVASKPAQLQSETDSKMLTLKQYRRTMGLCYKCGSKWSRDHKCAPEVLHAVQDIWSGYPDDEEDIVDDQSMPTESICLAISHSAVSGAPAPRTIQFIGTMQGLPLTFLIDLGSTSSFVSTTIVQQLSSQTVTPHSGSVSVAGGGILQLQGILCNAMWAIDDHIFFADLKVLPLVHFDVILGMDWLESHSPMMVHWKQKWLKFQYNNASIILHGMSSTGMDSVLLQVCLISDDVAKEDQSLNSLPVEVQSLIQQYQHLFEAPVGLPPTRSCNHSIPLLPNSKPVAIRPYRYPPKMKDVLEQQVAEMLQQGLIKPSASEFSSPVLLVPKKDGGYRFCVDYRQLNSITAISKFPVPIFDQLMDELAHAKWFSTLDLRAGFHQILTAPGEEFKTAFQTHLGHYEFNVMAFGLTGAPGTFQGAMNNTLAPGLRKFVIVFFDDILVYSKTYEEHLSHLEQVFIWLQQDKWHSKLSKCKFAQEAISYLGHVISAQGVSTDPKKIQAVQDWPQPRTVKEVRGFLGLAGYYRKFVKDFGVIAKPLTKLLCKDVPFIWTDIHGQAFIQLKHALSSAPCLALPDFSLPFHIETDASAVGVGAVLIQNGHPLAYVSKALGPKNQGLSTYEKEYLAILVAVDHWRPYFLQGQLVIHTDQQSLTHLNEQRLHTHWQQKVFTKLLGLNYKIVYKKGVENGAADALSRKPEAEMLFSLFVLTPKWLTDIAMAYQSDSEAVQLLS